MVAEFRIYLEQNFCLSKMDLTKWTSPASVLTWACRWRGVGGLQAAGGGALHRHAQHGHGEVLHPSGDLQPGELLNLVWRITCPVGIIYKLTTKSVCFRDLFYNSYNRSQFVEEALPSPQNLQIVLRWKNKKNVWNTSCILDKDYFLIFCDSDSFLF